MISRTASPCAPRETRTLRSERPARRASRTARRPASTSSPGAAPAAGRSGPSRVPIEGWTRRAPRSVRRVSVRRVSVRCRDAPPRPGREVFNEDPRLRETAADAIRRLEVLLPAGLLTTIEDERHHVVQSFGRYNGEQVGGFGLQ